jgi:excisionase family DNA binding protein
MLTVIEVASRLRVSPESVRRWVRQGRLHGVKVGRQLRISPEEVNRILSDGLDGHSHTSAPTPAAPVVAPASSLRRSGSGRREDPGSVDDEGGPEVWPAYAAYYSPRTAAGPRVIG